MSTGRSHKTSLKLPTELMGVSDDDITQYYKIYKKQLLGRGQYGKVSLATSKRDESLKYAVKTIKNASESDSKHWKRAKKEFEVHRFLDHANIAMFNQAFHQDDKLYLVIELCEGRNLSEVLLEKKQFSEEETKLIFYQALLAVNYLHQIGVCHRDVKAENFILGNDNKLKMIDFGLSEFFRNARLRSMVGTPYYVAPELFSGRYDQKCDEWSMGVLLFTMISGVPPFIGRTDEDTIERVKNGSYNYNSMVWHTVSKPAKELINSLLRKNPKTRITTALALQSSWFHELEVERAISRMSLLPEDFCDHIFDFRFSSIF